MTNYDGEEREERRMVRKQRFDRKIDVAAIER